MGIYEAIVEYGSIQNMDFNQFLVRAVISIGIIVLGIFLGKIITFGLKKLSQKLDLGKKIRGSFIDLFLVVIRWSIYIAFLSIALNQLGIAGLTTFFANILMTIPALTGALILILIGFSIAHYLRDVIKNSEINRQGLISEIVFYFILYIFGIYAIKTALISLNEITTNWIIVVLTAIMFAALAFVITKKELRKIK